MTLRNPFYPRQRRGRFCHHLQFLLFIIVICMYIHVIQLQSKAQYEKFNLFLLVLKLIMIFVGWAFILLSLSILLR